MLTTFGSVSTAFNHIIAVSGNKPKLTYIVYTVKAAVWARSVGPWTGATPYQLWAPPNRKVGSVYCFTVSMTRLDPETIRCYNIDYAECRKFGELNIFFIVSILIYF